MRNDSDAISPSLQEAGYKAKIKAGGGKIRLLGLGEFQ